MGRSDETGRPCEAACPKCGGTDVNREHRYKGDDWPFYRGNRERSNEFVCVHDFRWKAKREHVSHHCRTCHYEWETPVLAPRASAKLTPLALLKDRDRLAEKLGAVSSRDVSMVVCTADLMPTQCRLCGRYFEEDEIFFVYRDVCYCQDTAACGARDRVRADAAREKIDRDAAATVRGPRGDALPEGEALAQWSALADKVGAALGLEPRGFSFCASFAVKDADGKDAGCAVLDSRALLLVEALVDAAQEATAR